MKKTMHVGLTALMTPLIAAFVLAGCSSVPLDNNVPVETRNPTTAGSGGAGGANPSGAGQSGVTPIDLTKVSNTAPWPFRPV